MKIENNAKEVRFFTIFGAFEGLKALVHLTVSFPGNV